MSPWIKPFSVFTPITFFSSWEQFIFTALSLIIFTPNRSALSLRAFTMSEALSETGNTLFPLSVFNGTPKDSIKSMQSFVSNLDIAPYRKEGLREIFFRKVSLSQSLVILRQSSLPLLRR